MFHTCIYFKPGFFLLLERLLKRSAFVLTYYSTVHYSLLPCRGHKVQYGSALYSVFLGFDFMHEVLATWFKSCAIAYMCQQRFCNTCTPSGITDCIFWVLSLLVAALCV